MSNLTSVIRMQIDEIAALTARVAEMDSVLRSSVPDRHKGCTSPVGAVQSYIVDLENEAARYRSALTAVTHCPTNGDVTKRIQALRDIASRALADGGQHG